MNALRLPARMLAAAAGLAAFAPAGLHAQIPNSPGCNTVRTVNQTLSWVITQK